MRAASLTCRVSCRQAGNLGRCLQVGHQHSKGQVQTSEASSSSQAQLLLGRSCRWCSTASARSSLSALSECPASERYLQDVAFSLDGPSLPCTPKLLTHYNNQNRVRCPAAAYDAELFAHSAPPSMAAGGPKQI